LCTGLRCSWCGIQRLKQPLFQEHRIGMHDRWMPFLQTLPALLRASGVI
jgi:hypothetical protein